MRSVFSLLGGLDEIMNEWGLDFANTCPNLRSRIVIE
jgi:hypothetical protein